MNNNLEQNYFVYPHKYDPFDETLAIKFPEETKFEQIGSVQYKGEVYIPVLGNRVTQELAIKRRNAKRRLGVKWNHDSSTPGYYVWFRNKNKSLGRIYK